MLENLEAVTAQGTLKFPGIKSKLLLLVRNETPLKTEKNQYVL